MKEKIVTKNNVSIYTESFGNPNRPVVLLIAGATVSMLYWDQGFCERLADQGLFVIRFDNRDVGKSTNYETGKAPYDIIDLTNDALAILDAYQIEKAHFVGISLGGLITQLGALIYPDRVSTLTLMATGPWGPADPDIPEMDKRILDFQAKATHVNWKDENEVVAYMVQGAELMSGDKAFDKNTAETYVRAEFKRANNYPSMFNHATLDGGERYYDQLAYITQPTLIIHGTKDRIWHFENTRSLLSEIKDSYLLTLEGTGHELHRQDWEAITKAIAAHTLKN